MGANPTQAYGLIAFFAAFVLMAASAAGGGLLLMLLGLGCLALSVVLFLRCKPWEHLDDQTAEETLK